MNVVITPHDLAIDEISLLVHFRETMAFMSLHKQDRFNSDSNFTLGPEARSNLMTRIHELLLIIRVLGCT